MSQLVTDWKCGVFMLCLLAGLVGSGPARAYSVIDTRQQTCFDQNRAISCPPAGQDFYGQDAQYQTIQPGYQVGNGGLIVTDQATGLTWAQSPDTNGDGQLDSSDKLTWDQAQGYVDSLNAQNHGGYSDWRVPPIKELYSLMDFRGIDVGVDGIATPFIDTEYFNFSYGDTAAGERTIDAQYWSSNIYVGRVMNNQECAFGVNFADGRIKCYPTSSARFLQVVRGDGDYARNAFSDQGDGTVLDQATGLAWQKNDSGQGMIWRDALSYCQNLSQGGHDDWRLPDAKELQSIVDYTRSPDTSASPALDPVFMSTAITNEGGAIDWPFYWTSTTHENSRPDMAGAWGAYIAFGRALGYMSDGRITSLMDVHGAGAQRSDPKEGDPGQYAGGHGPQGDVVRIYNFARCVRGGL